jgi:hypothetical protein
VTSRMKACWTDRDFIRAAPTALLMGYLLLPALCWPLPSHAQGPSAESPAATERGAGQSSSPQQQAQPRSMGQQAPEQPSGGPLQIQPSAPPVQPGGSNESQRRWPENAAWLGVALVVFIFGGVCGFAIGRSDILKSRPPRRDRAEGERPTSLPILPVADAPGAKESFSRQYREFRDLYGAIWRAGYGDRESDVDRRKIRARWDERLKRLGQAPLVSAWSPLDQQFRANGNAREAAQIWLKALESWGLTRDHPKGIEVNDDTLSRFEVFPECTSGPAEVKEPCWTFDGIILQKGHAVPTKRG